MGCDPSVEETKKPLQICPQKIDQVSENQQSQQALAQIPQIPKVPIIFSQEQCKVLHLKQMKDKLPPILKPFKSLKSTHTQLQQPVSMPIFKNRDTKVESSCGPLKNDMFQLPTIEGFSDLKFDDVPQFKSKSQKLISGKTATLQNFAPVDCFQTVCIALGKYQGFYYQDGNYNSIGYLVKAGEVAELQAYQISAPKKKPKKWLASQHFICLNVSEQTKLFRIQRKNNVVSLIGLLKPNGKPFIQTGINISKLVNSIQIVVVPAHQQFPFIKYTERQSNLLIKRGTFFPSKTSKTIMGFSTFENIDLNDCANDMTLIAQKPLHDNNYYTNGDYNYSKWNILKGVINNQQAYKVYPPQSKPKQFLASKHYLALRIEFPTNLYFFKEINKDYFFYQKILPSTHKDGFTRTKLPLYDIKQPIIICLVDPSQQPIPTFGGYSYNQLELVDVKAKLNQPDINKIYKKFNFHPNKMSITVRCNKYLTTELSQIDFGLTLGNMALWDEQTKIVNKFSHKLQMGFVKNYQAYRISVPIKHQDGMPSSPKLAFRIKQRSKLYSSTSEGIRFLQMLQLDNTQEYKKFFTFRGFTLTDIRVDELIADLTVVIVPENQELSEFQQISPGLRRSVIQSNNYFKMELQEFQIPGVNFKPLSRYCGGAGSSYSPNCFLFVIKFKNRTAVLHKDMEKKLMLVFYEQLNALQLDLKLQKRQTIVAGCGDGQFGYFLLTNRCSNQEDKYSVCNLRAIKFDQKGKIIKSNQIDTSAKSINMHKFTKYEDNGIMTFLQPAKQLVATFARTMTRHTDGLNHQGSVTLIFDPSSLSLIKFFETCSHQFQTNHTITKNALLITQMGDASPRGVGVAVYQDLSIDKRTIFTFKTRHYEKPMFELQEYKEISTPSKKYYMGSNDNNTYAQLGGLVQDQEGYMVFFVSQRGFKSHLKIQKFINSPWEIAYVKLRKGFFKMPTPHMNWVTDQMVISEGQQERAFFYGFTGAVNQQRNKGVVWLTQQKLQDIISRLKVIPLQKVIVLVYEVWHDFRFKWTQVMAVDYKGSIVFPKKRLQLGIRLYRAEQPQLKEGRKGGFVLMASEDKITKVQFFPN